ncbi:peptidyl-prolyl cis-trans isomerase [Sinimarinibacterium sp. CAU 1509]|uniref:peptidylprolyl isomerase n=1 Tax=Sinimarinibacterium sp. CAU 1509 TaxID=2562283 RepID=UPI00146A813C|nr:peptidylprolyl isomerase [Sinimarinibacterium sp. CAU 1509]
MRLQKFIDALSRLQHRHAPLLFLALGAALFAADILHRSTPPLVAPDAAAGQGATRWLEDEVLYREALARGLDDGDLIVRRRLAQKMRLLLETGVDVAEPDANTLQHWIDTHAERYGGVTQLSMDHVFLSRARHDTELEQDAERVAARLRADNDVGDFAALSDPHPASTRIDNASSHDTERLFGKALAQQLAQLPEGGWQGPLSSPLGLHLVRIRSRQLQTPDYAAVQARAQRDYLIEQRRLHTQDALKALMTRYGVADAGASS